MTYEISIEKNAFTIITDKISILAEGVDNTTNTIEAFIAFRGLTESKIDYEKMIKDIIAIILKSDTKNISKYFRINFHNGDLQYYNNFSYDLVDFLTKLSYMYTIENNYVEVLLYDISIEEAEEFISKMLFLNYFLENSL